MKYEYDCENKKTIIISNRGLKGSLILRNCKNLEVLYCNSNEISSFVNLPKTLKEL